MDEFLLFVQETMGWDDQMVYRHMETEECFQPYFLNLGSSSSLITDQLCHKSYTSYSTAFYI